MTFRSLLLALCVIITCRSVCADEQKAEMARVEFDTLVEQFEDEGGTSEYATRFFELAEHHRSDPVAVDAYIWILRNRRMKEDASRALNLLYEHHLEDPQMEKACRWIARVPSPKAERLLSALVKAGSQDVVRATACHRLALLLEQQASTLEQLSMNPQLKQRAAQYYGKHVVDMPLTHVTAKLERTYEQMAREFGSISLSGEQLEAVANQALFRLRHLSVGRIAPEIEGEDIFGKTFKLSDHRGKINVLNFWAHW